MKIVLLLLIALSLVRFSRGAEVPTATVATAARFEINPAAAGLRALRFSEQALQFSAGGGFAVFDTTAKAAVALPAGRVEVGKEKTIFTSEGEGLSLHASFSSWQGAVRVEGEIVNTRGDERGFIVSFQVPRLSGSAVFSSDLDKDHPLADGAKEEEGNDVPLAAMTDAQHGVALALPPDAPRIYGLAGGTAGLTVRFYLGTSPDVRAFPSRASFVFLIYPAQPGWGFRSALSRYYRLFSDYYTPRLPREGFFMFQMADRVPPNVSDYGFNLAEMQLGPKVITAALARDDAHGISTFPYMIVGQREIKFLPELPKDYDGALEIAKRWTFADLQGHPVSKENTANRGDFHLKEELETSAVQTSDGRWSFVLRKTEWGENSITYRVNPSPYLSVGENQWSVGKLALQVAGEWHAAHPSFDGTYVDSLGANWPAVLNYRRDHFRAARFPLTVDSTGRVALHNLLSHYEYVEALRRLMHAQGKLVLGNGVYAYRSRNNPRPGVERQSLDDQYTEYTSVTAAPEHYRPGVKLGRFFLGALLDVASSEAGVRATVERCRDVRTIMGPKPYAFLNYHWDDRAKVEEYFNKSLAYGIYATMTKDFFTGIEYDDHPQGYPRDKALIAWAIALMRRLNQAGWEPVTHARVEGGDDLVCERFGRGQEIYLTLYNDAATVREATVNIDAAALGFAGGKFAVREIARESKVTRTDSGAWRLPLQPKSTYVLALTPASP